MNINRHNYETIFLLYADNELSAAEKEMVERFVAENTDLLPELKRILHSRMVPDKSIRFTAKNELLKYPIYIDLSNCEDYFILYFDNELNDIEKAAVEEYVSKNKEAAPLFETFRQLKLMPDNTKEFENKNSLLKESPLVHENNCTAYFMMYADNELDAEQRKAVEQFLLQYPHYEKEFYLLHQTKLSVDNTIVYADKNQLYKKEKPATIFSLNRRSIAAAAAILLLISTSIVFYFNKPIADKQPKFVDKSNPNDTNAKNEELNSANSFVYSNLDSQALAKLNEQNIAQKAVENSRQNKSENQQPLKEAIFVKNENHLENAVTNSSQESYTNSNSAVTNPENTMVVETKSLTKVDATLQENKTDVVVKSTKSISTINNLKIENLATSTTIKPAALIVTGNAQPENDYDDAGDETQKRGLVKGIFRKAKRLITRNTDANTDNENKKKGTLNSLISAVVN